MQQREGELEESERTGGLKKKKVKEGKLTSEGDIEEDRRAAEQGRKAKGEEETRTLKRDDERQGNE